MSTLLAVASVLSILGFDSPPPPDLLELRSRRAPTELHVRVDAAPRGESANETSSVREEAKAADRDATAQVQPSKKK